MQLFDDIDDPKNKDVKLTTVEKSVILGFTVLGKRLLRKARKAKTYGDLAKVIEWVDNKMEETDVKAKAELGFDPHEEENLTDEQKIDLAVFMKQQLEEATQDIE